MSDPVLALRAALAAVRAASRVCRDVQRHLVTAQTIEKKDKSPVTVADYASQAITCALLTKALPGERVVGEEDSQELREGAQAAVRASVVEHVRSGLGADASEAQVLDWIDLGGAEARGARYWTLDPIDGTKGFLRGEQYAIALGLLEEGEVVAGVLGCPNLALGDEQGALFAASRGQGSRVYSLWDESDEKGTPVHVAAVSSASGARFCESVESGHSNQDESARIAERLGITGEPFRIDSQCKYAAVARGDASIYLRMPTRKDYREKIWDHAAGKIVVEEAGGRVSDVEGRPLDFTHGRTLDENRGIVATSGAIHDEVVEAVRTVRAGRSSVS
ncbi:MAG: 3'(2'),5'-bisphosphate nucleotidase [Myxococcota bacterium]|nr:3'(2'),5'-bisphosphate nucleotidase [Myxococcota bacterium]